MLRDFTIAAGCYNKDTGLIEDKMFLQEDYARMQSGDLKKLQAEIEADFCVLANADKPNWDDETYTAFQRIRHKLLDKANAIERLPESMYYKNMPCNSIPANEVLAKVIDNQ